MKFFEKYVSNTYAGSANQHFFTMEEDEIRTGRILYKISVGGRYNYSLLFSNIIDSTYAKGEVSHKNIVCDSWTIHSAKIGKCKKINEDKDIEALTMADEGEGIDADVIVSDVKDITFNGSKSKEVMPAEFFSSDPISLEYETDEYLCLEITFSGKMIPYHEESILPVFTKDKDGWKYSRKMPVAGMIGCDRPVLERVAYLGDSITQGIGPALNSYKHWNALLSRKLGDKYAFWNLGIGFAKANDAATNSAWLFKAKQNDTVFVCCGANDASQHATAEQMISDLSTIIDKLKEKGARVILQTIPPLDYEDKKIAQWERANEVIKTELRDKVDLVFDIASLLTDEKCPGKAKYGAHPNEEGSALWADALYDAVKELFE